MSNRSSRPSTAAPIRSTSSAETHIGFSTSTDFPASSPAITCSQCASGGVLITSPWTSAASSTSSNPANTAPPPHSPRSRSALSLDRL